MNDRPMFFRFALSALFYLALTTGLGFRLAFLHLGPHDERRERIENLRQFREDLRGRRGAVFARGGQEHLLSLDVTVKNICANPSVLVASNAVGVVAKTLADALGLEADRLAVRLNHPRRLYARVQRYVDVEEAKRVKALGLPGVFLEDTSVRYYPHGSFLCHVLGFVNYEGVGSAGIEQRYDRYLKGEPGVREGRVNALRQEMYLERERYIPGRPGHQVELTIDIHIQHMVEKVIDELMETYQPEAAWSIVQAVRTGEILAMVSRPAFDLNRFFETQPEVRMNRAIAFNYEPGSTMKAAAFAAALNEGIVDTETLFDCENGSWYYRGSRLRDVSPQGKLTVREGLVRSSNILTAKMSLMLGNERLYRYLSAFGVGMLSGIDLPGEQAGIFHSPERWYGISPTRIPIGQGVATTALQILGIYSTLANDGFLMKPYVVREIRDAEGKTVFTAQPEVVRRVVRPETAAIMRELLEQATGDQGTGRRARVPGLRVAGKTGTAQKPVPGGYSDTDYIASFVGFFPADKPEVAIIVVADAPKPVHGGGVVAAPAFSTIAGELSRYLGLGVHVKHRRETPHGQEIAAHRHPSTESNHASF